MKADVDVAAKWVGTRPNALTGERLYTPEEPPLDIDGAGATGEAEAYAALKQLAFQLREKGYGVGDAERVPEFKRTRGRPELKIRTGGTEPRDWLIDVKSKAEGNWAYQTWGVSEAQLQEYLRLWDSGERIAYFFLPARVFASVRFVSELPPSRRNGRGYGRGSKKPFIDVTLEDIVVGYAPWYRPVAFLGATYKNGIGATDF